MVKTPEFNDRSIKDQYQIELPVYVWIAIGNFLQYLNDSTDTNFPVHVAMMLDKINDMIFPEAFQKSEQARYEQQKQERVASHPLTQIFSQLPGSVISPFPTLPDPEDFNGPDDIA